MAVADADADDPEGAQRVYEALRGGRYVLLLRRRSGGGPNRVAGLGGPVDAVVCPQAPAEVVVIRPDAYIGWASDESGPAVFRALAAHLGVAGPGRGGSATFRRVCLVGDAAWHVPATTLVSTRPCVDHREPSMKAILWTVRTDTGGQVSITPRPRPHDWLDQDLQALRAAAVDDLVSALTRAEADDLGLGGEPGAARAAGLGFHALPILDLGVPGNTRELLAALGPLADRVRSGAHVAVHCRAGIGRSGVIASLLLALNGWEPGPAMAHLSSLRGQTIPETDEQRAWILAAAAAAAETAAETAAGSGLRFQG